MYTGQNTRRSLGVRMEVPLSQNQLVSLVPLQTAILSLLPATSASALQQLQAFTPPYWKKPQGAFSNLSASFFHSRYSHSSCSSSCGTTFFSFFLMLDILQHNWTVPQRIGDSRASETSGMLPIQAYVYSRINSSFPVESSNIRVVELRNMDSLSIFMCHAEIALLKN